MKQIARLGLYSFVAVMLTACSHASLTVQQGTIPQTEAITTVAYMPVLRVKLAPDQARILIDAMSSKWKAVNPHLIIVPPGQSIMQLTRHERLQSYQDMAELYYNTGAIDDKKVGDVCAVLQADALLQGALYGVQQHDASFVDWATTKVTLGYSLISCTSGQILWSASSDASNKGFWSWSKAAPVYEVMMLAQESIYTSLPPLPRR